MPAKSATSRKWRAGAVHAARAAAFLSIATGVNSVLTAMYPRYEPVYAYLAAVVVVAWMSSALLGVTAAVAATVLYDWMFAPVRVVPSMSFAIPLTIAVAIAIATRAARVPLERPLLAEAVQPPRLLPPVERLAPVDVIVDDTHVRELRQQIEHLERCLAGAHSQREEQERLRAEEKVTAESREALLAAQVDTLRQSVTEQNARLAASRRESDAMAQRVTEADARTASFQQNLESARHEIEEHERLRAEEKAAADSRQAQLTAEIETLRRNLESARRQIKEQTERANREVKAREELEVAGHAALQKAIGDLSVKYETALAESKTRGESLQKSLAELTAKHGTLTASAQTRAEGAAAKVQALQLELDRTLASLAGEHARADREAKLRGQLETAARETLHRTADVAAAHQREASQAREKAQAAEQKAAALQREGEQLRSQLEEARAQIERLSQANDQRVQLERDLADAKRIVEQETLRVTFESAARQKVADEAASARKELETTRDLLESERRRVVEARNVAQTALTDLEAERGRIAAMKSERERLEKEWNEKLQTIVAHMAEDHETDIGQAMLEREAARAETRKLTARLAALQKQVEEDRDKFQKVAERWQRRSIEQPAPAVDTGRPAVVLVVHSDPGTRAMARHSLEQAGYSVITAADGLEGLRTATQQKPDVVVAEPLMPKMNARELVQLLKSRRETAGMKIVLLSGKGDLEKGADYRADDIIRNPADLSELRNTLANVLARTHA